MSEFTDLHFSGTEPFEQQEPTSPTHEPVVETAAPEAPVQVVEMNGHNGTASDLPNWHADAGRKGAHRVHELIRHGKLYEQEHGLKSGRQRLRQLIEEGKLYEQEHGLSRSRRARGERPVRMSNEDVIRGVLQSLLRLAKPSVRKQLARMIEALDREETVDAGQNS